MKKEKTTAFEKKVPAQFILGKNLFGEESAFVPLLKNVIEKALEAEMEAHLTDKEHHNGNYRQFKRVYRCYFEYFPKSTNATVYRTSDMVFSPLCAENFFSKLFYKKRPQRPKKTHYNSESFIFMRPINC